MLLVWNCKIKFLWENIQNYLYLIYSLTLLYRRVKDKIFMYFRTNCSKICQDFGMNLYKINLLQKINSYDRFFSITYLNREWMGNLQMRRVTKDMDGVENKQWNPPEKVRITRNTLKNSYSTDDNPLLNTLQKELQCLIKTPKLNTF